MQREDYMCQNDIQAVCKEGRKGKKEKYINRNMQNRKKRGPLLAENVEKAETFHFFFVSVFIEMFRRAINLHQQREMSINQNKEKTA